MLNINLAAIEKTEVHRNLILEILSAALVRLTPPRSTTALRARAIIMWHAKDVINDGGAITSANVRRHMEFMDNLGCS